MNRATALVMASLLTACGVDFGLQSISDSELAGEDTGALPEVDDTGWPEDEEEDPIEEEPVEEEAPEDDCTETSDLIYVIDRGSEELSLFDPETAEFTVLGRLSCPSGTATPGSMAVSRSGEAFVRYSDESVYRVTLETLACERTGFRSPNGFGSFGMGYATDDADTWRDRLYIADADSVGLLDTSAWSLDLLGGMESQSELTGTSAGELWAFLPLESPASLAQLDKDSGEELQRIRLSGFPSLSDIDAFAFAAWGGEFWLFVRTYGMGSSTDVYRVGSDGRLSRVLEDVGFDVVGAGVSTCAPSE
jgi:hypothetical protein